MNGNVLLSAVVGSTAYGLATPDSDVDRLGVFAAPTSTFLGLDQPTERSLSTVRHDPDVTMHEVGKFLRLALAGNPAVVELLWLSRTSGYEVLTDDGDELRMARRKLLCRARVRSAYLGYADQQLRRLKGGQVPARRRAKHARHLARLMFQVAGLHRTGDLTVQLATVSREDCFALGEQAAAGQYEAAEKLIASTALLLDTTPSAIPEEADRAFVDAWLVRLRRRMLRDEQVAGALHHVFH